MNVYDFDGTIYRGDSTVDFFLYCLRMRPRIAVCMFRQTSGVLRHAAGAIDTTQMKEEFFSFLSALDDPEELAVSFWEARRRKIQSWYLERKKALYFLGRNVWEGMSAWSRGKPNSGYALDCHDSHDHHGSLCRRIITLNERRENGRHGG